jgi:hypothetical protein
MDEVRGSTPLSSTRCEPRKNRCPEVAGKLARTWQFEAAWRHAAHKFRARSSFGRAFPSHGKGGEFDPRRVHQVMGQNKRDINARYRSTHRKELRRKQNENRAALKLEALEKYGRVCAVCGFNDPRALQIDHVENNGSEERRKLGGQGFAGWQFYRWLKSQGWPEGYQTLCANHNIIKFCESRY